VFDLSWWEPNTPGALDIGDASAILFFFIALFTAIVGVGRWWMRQLKSVIKKEISDATIQIQPNANGGLSLPDVARKVGKLEETVDKIQKDNLETREIILQVLVDKEIKTKRVSAKKTA
jgi:hypothetical protein